MDSAASGAPRPMPHSALSSAPQRPTALRCSMFCASCLPQTFPSSYRSDRSEQLPAFRDQNGASLSAARCRAMTGIERCRTAALGGHVERCGDCGHQRVSYNSCRNNSCPRCQGLARAQWFEDRQSELLEVPYFHVVFTVPQEIEVIAFQNQVVVYDILFRAASETLRTIAADPKHLGAEIGFLGVLHTWGQNLLQNPQT